MASKKLTKAHQYALASIKAATTPEGGYGFVNPTIGADLAAAGHILVDTSVTDANGNVAAKAVATEALTQAAPVAESTSVTFEIMDGLTPTNTARGGIKEEIYPFSKLGVGQSFFVPVTAKMSDPAKQFASTVSGANRRFGSPDPAGATKTVKGKTVPVLVYSRHFTLRPVKAGQTYTSMPGFVEKADGARVFRTT